MDELGDGSAPRAAVRWAALPHQDGLLVVGLEEVPRTAIAQLRDG
jgi:hypothetical protein